MQLVDLCYLPRFSSGSFVFHPQQLLDLICHLPSSNVRLCAFPDQVPLHSYLGTSCPQPNLEFSNSATLILPTLNFCEAGRQSFPTSLTFLSTSGNS